MSGEVPNFKYGVVTLCFIDTWMMGGENSVADIDPRKKTRPVSFRMSEDLIFELRKEASMNQKDLGSFGRDILSKYLVWGRHAEKVGLLPISKEFMKDVLEYLPDDVVRKLASKAGRNEMVELTLSAEGNLTAEGFFTVFNNWLDACGITYRLDRKDLHRYTITHGLGKKWSVYLQSLFAAMCEELPTKLRVDTELKADSIVIKLKSTQPPSY